MKQLISSLKNFLSRMREKEHECWSCLRTFRADFQNIDHAARHTLQDPLARALSHFACVECCEHRTALKKSATEFYLFFSSDHVPESVKTDENTGDVIETTEMRNLLEKGLNWELIDAYGKNRGRPIHIYHEGAFLPVNEWYQTNAHKQEVKQMLLRLKQANRT